MLTSILAPFCFVLRRVASLCCQRESGLGPVVSCGREEQRQILSKPWAAPSRLVYWAGGVAPSSSRPEMYREAAWAPRILLQQQQDKQQKKLASQSQQQQSATIPSSKASKQASKQQNYFYLSTTGRIVGG